jgi:hypothetical protein
MLVLVDFTSDHTISRKKSRARCQNIGRILGETFGDLLFHQRESTLFYGIALGLAPTGVDASVTIDGSSFTPYCLAH